MFEKRKAQGLSVHTIIVAIIGLIILVAIVLMLTGKLGGFDEGVTKISGDVTKTCTEIIGSDTRKSKTDCDDIEDARSVLSSDTIGTSDVCCTS
jgi:hypothetical protein